MHTEFMAFVNDETSGAVVRAWAEHQGFPADTVQNGGAEFFMNLLESEAPPKFVIVDVDGHAKPVQIAARLVSLCGPASKIVALGSANDVSLYRSMLAAGLIDYLVKPMNAEMMTQALTLANREGLHNTGNETKEARVVVMIGVRGGVGTSTLAVNTAWMLAHEKKQKTALLDLDLHYGTSALALDLEPGRGLCDIVGSPQRVDHFMVTSAMVNESENLSILSAEQTLDEIPVIDPSAVSALIKEIKPNFRFVFIDMPSHLIPAQKRFLVMAQDIVLVTDMSLAGIRDTLRIRNVLKSIGSSARVTLVATRNPAVDESLFTKGVQVPINFTIPEDHKTVIAASNAGKMLGASAPNAAVTKTIRALVQYLHGEIEASETAKKKSGFFAKLTGIHAKVGVGDKA